MCPPCKHCPRKTPSRCRHCRHRNPNELRSKAAKAEAIRANTIRFGRFPHRCKPARRHRRFHRVQGWPGKRPHHCRCQGYHNWYPWMIRMPYRHRSVDWYSLRQVRKCSAYTNCHRRNWGVGRPHTRRRNRYHPWCKLLHHRRMRCSEYGSIP